MSILVFYKLTESRLDHVDQLPQMNIAGHLILCGWVGENRTGEGFSHSPV